MQIFEIKDIIKNFVSRINIVSKEQFLQNYEKRPQTASVFIF